MVSIRCDVFFVFAIIFILLHFVASSLQDTEKMVSMAEDRFEERTTVLSRQEKDPLKAMMNGKVIGWRKTMKMVNEEHTYGEEMASSSSANPRNGDDKTPKASSSSAKPRVRDDKVPKASSANPRNGDDNVPKAASASSNPRNADIKVPKASSSSSNPRNGDHKVPKRQKKIYHHDHEHHVEVKMRSTFMALNADYHVPRSHPPRNN